MVGQTLEVLVEGTSKLRVHREETAGLVQLGNSSPNADEVVRLVARTRGDEIVAFDGPVGLVGQIVEVQATAATALSLNAKFEGVTGSVWASNASRVSA